MSTALASSYFDRLHDLLTAVDVTDDVGTRITLENGLARAVDIFLDCGQRGRTAYLIGNGGSAAIADHMQNDLVAAAGLRAMVFNDSSLLTATANDHGYANVFLRPLSIWAGPGDVLLAISSSGASANITSAVAYARQGGLEVITLTGFQPDNAVRETGSLNFYIDSDHYGMVELAHGCITHCMSDAAADFRRKELETTGAASTRPSGGGGGSRGAGIRQSH